MAADEKLPPVLRAVAAQVRRVPDAEAVRFEGTAITYRELWERAERIAERLVGMGVGSGGIVGVHLNRSIDLVVAIVAVLRAGSVLVPLDVTYPAERLRYMRADADVEVLLGHADPLERLGGTRPLATDGGLVLAACGEGPRGGGGGSELPRMRGEDLAYIVYTSGSTGRPKGVLYEHRNLANLVAWQIEASRCGAGERTLQFAPASFDVVFQETLTTLGEGGTVVCCTDDDRLDPHLLWELIARERVNRLFMPFVMIQGLALFADEATPETHPLREILTSGEQMQVNSRIRAMFERLPDCRLVNQWGTTETHVATWHVLPADAATWPQLPPIGSPIRGARVHVCGEDGNPVSAGQVGELWIAGDCVGPGFLNLPEQTARSYVPDPLDPTVRAFRSGDLGRIGENGELECLGRRDSQVKVRGFRIELGEIEAVLNSIPAVAEAVVVAAGAVAEERFLQAFVVPKQDAVLDRAAVLAELRRVLPGYMVPSRLEVVGSLPRTPSGKLDRRAVAAG